MTFNCLRCGKDGEYHKGKITGGTTGKFYALKQKVNNSKVVTLNRLPGNQLCIECLEELLAWLTDKKPGVQVK